MVVHVHFKRANTIRNFLVFPKDKDRIMQKSGVIYRFKCAQPNCEEGYVGESARTFGKRFKEQLRAPFPSVTMVAPQVIASVWTISP